MRRRVLSILAVSVGVVLGSLAGMYAYARKSAAEQKALARDAIEQAGHLNRQAKAMLLFTEAQWLMERRDPARAAQVLSESPMHLPGYAALARSLLSQGVPYRTVFSIDSARWHTAPSPDGKKLWVLGGGGLSEIITIDDPEHRVVLEGESSARGTWTRDSLKIVQQFDHYESGQLERKQCVSDAETGKQRACYPYAGNVPKHFSDELSFDGRLWAYREFSAQPQKPGLFRLFDSETGADLYDPKARKPAVFEDAEHWAFHPKEYRLAFIDGKKKTLRIADATSGAQICAGARIKEPVQQVLWSRHGRFVATVLEKSGARVWDAVHCAELTAPPVDSPDILRLAARGPALESWMPVGFDDIVHARADAQKDEPLWAYRASARAFPDGLLLSPRAQGAGLRAVFRPAGSLHVYIKNIEANTQALLIGDASIVPDRMLWNEEGDRLFSMAGASVHEWNPEGTAAELLWRTGGGEALSAAAWSPDGKYIAVAIGGSIRLLHTEDDQRPLIEGNTQNIRTLGFSSNGRALVAVFVDGEKKAWDAATREKIPMNTALGQEHLFASGDEQRYGMLVIDESGGLRMIPAAPSADTNQNPADAYPQEQILARPGFGITYAAWSPSGNRILGVSRGGAVHLWAMSAERLQKQLHTVNADCMPIEARTDLLMEPTADAQQALQRCKNTPGDSRRARIPAAH